MVHHSSFRDSYPDVANMPEHVQKARLRELMIIVASPDHVMGFSGSDLAKMEAAEAAAAAEIRKHGAALTAARTKANNTRDEHWYLYPSSVAKGPQIAVA